MTEKTGFTSMADAHATGNIPTIGVGMLGYAFMGKAHSNAYKTIPYMMYPPPANPRLVAIAGRNAEGVQEAARRYGYETYYTDWHKLLDDDRVQLFDNAGPNYIHGEACIAAAQAGKHIFCEKPLARSSAEAKQMLDAANKAGIKHMVAFNYRFLPAIRLAYDLIQQGALGRIYHFRAVYLQEWVMPHYNMGMTWRLDQGVAGGGGVLGDLGTHIIDLGRFLVGEMKTVSAITKIFTPERPNAAGEIEKIVIPDAFVSAVEFDNGAIGTLESTRFAAGHKNYEFIEINGEKGTIRFDLERLNELEVFWVNDEPRETQGFHNIMVSEAYHPFWKNWWPQGHIIGWEHTFIHELTHMLDCIVNNKEVAPYGATFEDGYRAEVISEAIVESSLNRKHIDIQY